MGAKTPSDGVVRPQTFILKDTVYFADPYNEGFIVEGKIHSVSSTAPIKYDVEDGNGYHYTFAGGQLMKHKPAWVDDDRIVPFLKVPKKRVQACRRKPRGEKTKDSSDRRRRLMNRL